MADVSKLYPQLPHDRARGRTTRTLWRALLEASEHGSRVFVVVQTDKLGEWTFGYLCRLAVPVAEGPAPRGPVQFDRTRHRVVLPNGGSVEVVSERWLSDRGRGLSGVKVIYDHSI
jgi:hypothetical protein